MGRYTSVFENVRKKKKQENKTTNTTPKYKDSNAYTSGGGGESTGRYKHVFETVKKGGYDNGVDGEYINSFLKDSNDFLSTFESDSKNIKYSNSSSIYDTHTKTSDDLRKRADKIRQYLWSHKGNIDEKAYNELNLYLTRFNSSADTARNYLKSKNDYYSQWKTEDDYIWSADETREQRQQKYKDNQKRIEEIDKLLANTNYNYDSRGSVGRDIKADYVKQLKDEKQKLQTENLNYERGTSGYASKIADDSYDIKKEKDYYTYARNRDFNNPTREELMQRDTAKDSSLYYTDAQGNTYDVNGNLITEDYLKGLEGDSINDKLGIYLNATEQEKKEAASVTMQDEDTWTSAIKDGFDKSWDYLKNDEINIYYYLLNKEGQDEAYRYLDALTTELNRRETSERQQQIDDASALEKIMLSVASVPESVFGGILGFVDDTAHYIAGEEINPYSKAHSMMNEASMIRESTARDINEATGNANLWGFSWGSAYQSALSAADSALGTALGSTAYAVLMGTSAAASEAKDLYEQGATNYQIALGSLLAGAAELIFEKVSIENLIKMRNAESVFEVVRNLLIQGGVEASEEGFTEIANTITDCIVRGSQSDFARSREAYKSEGMSDAQAQAKALLDVGSNIWQSSAGGFLSGVFGGATQASVGYGINNSETKQQGQSIIDDNGYDALRTLAEQTVGGTDTKETQRLSKALERANKKTNAKNVGRLSNAVETARVAQNTTDIQSQLAKKGVDKRTAKKVAEVMSTYIETGAIGRAATDDIISEAMGSLYDDEALSSAVSSVRNDLINSETNTVNMRNVDQRLARAGVQSIRRDDGTLDVDATAAQLEEAPDTVVENKFVTSADGKTLDSNGEEITVKKIVSNRDGQMTVETEDGQRLSADSISFATEGEALVYSELANMDVNAANIMLDQYKMSSDTIDAADFALGVAQAYNYGYYNYPAAELTRENAEAAKLTETQRNQAYKLGKLASGKQVALNTAKVRRAVEGVKKASAAKRKEGVVHFDREGRKFDSKQEVSLKTMEILSKATGIDFYVFESTVNAAGERVYRDENGITKSADINGYFDPKTNSIHIDLNSGADGQGTMLFTLAHELTHFVKKWSPAKFKVLANFLAEKYSEKGYSMDARVAAKMQEAKDAKRNLTYDEAYEEVVADSMESILTSGNVVEALAELKQRDKTLGEKIIEFFKKFVADIKKMLFAYKGVNPDSVEGNIVAGMKDVIAQIEKLYTEALYTAGENYQLVEGAAFSGKGVSVTEDGTILLQQRHYRESGRATLFGYLTERYGEENASDLISVIDNIYNVMEDIKRDNPELTVFSQWQETEIEVDENGKPIFTTNINNGDYVLNQDFSRVCKKRRQLDFVLNLLAADPEFEAKYLTKSSFVKINDAIKKHGFEIACALCFVDAKRFRQAEWADSFANTWNDILESVVKDKSKLTPFNFATDSPNINDESIDINTDSVVSYRKWSNGKVDETRTYNNIEYIINARKENGKDYLEGNANVRTIARLIRDNPNLRHTFRGADIISSKGFDSIQRLVPDLRDILDGWGGSSVPKPSSLDASYDSSILNLTEYNKEKAYAMGGARMNSFSDFMAHMFFDYCEAFADLAAKELPMQAYTKELAFARLFGAFGGKINMSGIPAIRSNSLPLENISKAQKDKNTEIEKRFAGLDVSKIAEHLGIDVTELTESDIEQFLDLAEYVWADESIDMMKATLLQSGIMYDRLSETKQAECYELIKAGKMEEALSRAGKKNVDRNYAKHLGTIVVGVSDAHIRKMLRDDTIRMVIPYHKSGLNPQIAQLLKISAFNDYTKVQSTGIVKKNGKRYNLSSKEIKDSLGLKDFNFYDYFGKTIDGVLYDGRATADKYLEWCEKGVYDEKVGDYVYYTTKDNGNGYILAKELHKKGRISPKFEQFTDEMNYYKVLEDFDCYDTITGEHSPQGAVQMLSQGLPADYKDILLTALKAEQKVADDFADHLENRGLKEEILEIVKKNGYNPETQTMGVEIAEGDFYDDKVKNSLRIKDKKTLDFLNNQETVTTYKTMQLIDGKLYPPMAARTEGEYEDYSVLGKWEQAVEHPELIKGGNKYKLDKGKGQGSIEAAYNPYMHSSNLVINDQFTSAYKRDNLVTVECEVPVSELTSGYKAQYAKNSVGWHAWHTGTVAAALRNEKGIERQGNLSRDIKPVRILSDSEVAGMYKELLDGTNIAVPDNVVTPSLLSELKKAGVKIKESGKVKVAGDAETRIKAQARVSSKADADYLDAVERGDMVTAQRMVDEAAKASGYDSPKLYHGTNKFGFTKFLAENSDDRLSFFLSNNKLVAETYSGKTDRHLISERASITPEGLEEASPEKLLELLREYINEDAEMVSKDEYEKLVEQHRDEIRHAIEMVESIPTLLGDVNGKTQEVLDNVAERLRRMERANTYDDFMEAHADYNDSFWDLKWENEKAADVLSELIGEDVRSAYQNLTDYLGEALFKGEGISTNKRKYINTVEAVNKLYSVLFNGIYQLYVDSGKQLIVDAKGEYWNQIDARSLGFESPVRTRDIAKYAKENGYNSVQIKNLRDSGDYSYMGQSDVYIFFGNNRLKSADPVTYDDAGNVIPLSERFKAENNDIRYQQRQTESMSNRSLLANALESAMTNDIEKKNLENYKEKISLLDAEEKKLAELNRQIKEMSFTKGKKDVQKLKVLNSEKTKTENRINTYDKQLLKLEASKPLEEVLRREKRKAYKRAEQKGRKALNKLREEKNARYNETVKRYQESRKNAIEKRNRTEARRKVIKVVNELNNLLLNGNKKKHVMLELQKPVAEALSIVNMDTVGADARIEELNKKIASAKDETVRQALEEKRDRLIEQGSRMKEKLDSLAAKYDAFKNSDDPDVANAYDDGIATRIKTVSELIGNTPIRYMTLEQLEEVHDMFTMVLTKIRDRNKAFIGEKRENIAAQGNRVMEEVLKVGGSRKMSLKALGAIKSFMWNNLKPVYAFKAIGSDTLTNAYENVRKGEETWAIDIEGAKNYCAKMRDKYKFKEWDFKKKFSFKSTTGNEFTLTLEQMMSLYAYSKRQQADAHLEKGGFVFDDAIEVTEKTKAGVPVKYKVNTSTAYNITRDILNDIISNLTDQQKGYVDEMQSYLSIVMGEKGNQVSMAMYGVKLFKEKNYFPLKSAKQFMFEQNEVAGEVKIKNAGFSQDTVANASNPIILSNFSDVWAGHVNDMSMYHAFVLPLEDFNRIYNYKTPNSANLGSESVKMYLQNAYGRQANAYISQFITDVNGGVRSDPRESPAKSMMSKWKKASVGASWSVVIQQPSAVARALSLIDAKYFIYDPKMIKRGTWEEIKKYAPVAIIKEMGRFDTDTGRSTIDYINGAGSAMDKFTDILGKPAEFADEITWCHIWNAVKNETKAKHKELKPNSETFLQVAGKRFTEVITQTQVYDSTFSRSANMRAKTGLMTMVTAFMAEPTTSINMVVDAILQGKRGNKLYARKTIRAVYFAVILNSALSALVYGLRDDDEDETFLEKYLTSFTAEMLDGINPATYIPWVKDAWSMLQGYDVERSDLTLVGDFVDSFKKMTGYLGQDTEDMDEEELAEHKQGIIEASWGIAESLANVLGIPVRNVRRDVNAIINTVQNAINNANNGVKNNAYSMGDKLLETVKDSTPVWGRMKGESKEDRLYRAIMSGNEDYINRVKNTYSSDSSLAAGIKKALRKNDPRILEAAKARYNGDISTYKNIVYAIKGEGYFSQDDIVAAINAEMNSLDSGEETTSSSKVKSMFTSEDFAKAIAANDSASANAVKEDIIATAVANGKTQEEAEKSFKSSAKSVIRAQLEEGAISDSAAINAFMTYGEMDEDEAQLEVDTAAWKAEYGDYDLTTGQLQGYFAPIENYGGQTLEDVGLDMGAYETYCLEKVKCTGTDEDGDGKTDSGSKKAQVMAVIDSLPITYEQKDALYYMNGWSSRTIYEAPWH